MKAIELSGESPDRGIRYRPVAEGNCVFVRKGGEQLEAKEQSVTNCELDSAKPVGEPACNWRTPDLMQRPNDDRRSAENPSAVGETPCTVTERGNV